MNLRSIAIDVSLARIWAGMTIAALLFSALPLQFAVATSAPVNTVTICHATDSSDTPYERDTVPANSTVSDHSSHAGDIWVSGATEWGDIIPPFTYYQNDERTTFPGQNWTPEGEAIWQDNCAVPGPQSVAIKFVKKFDGVSNGFTPEQFSFAITGDSDVTLASDEEYTFTAGSYTVTEVGPDSFDPDHWRIKWTCPDVQMSDDDGNDHDATFTVTESNYTDGAIFCTAENQYRPLCTDEAALNTGNSEVCEYSPETCDDPLALNTGAAAACEYPPVVCDDPLALNTGAAAACEYETTTSTSTGTIVIVKEVTASSSTSTPFTFTPSWGADFSLLAGESTSTELATGTYSIAEVVPAGWNSPETNCVSSVQDIEIISALDLAADETITCTFRNDEQAEGSNTGGDGDGGGTDSDTFIINGYVWHDDNENTIWEGFDQEEATTTEDELTGWTVTITDGNTTKSTVTDAAGYYEFEVPAGTWTITESVQNGWKQTAPVSGSHVVTVPEVLTQSLSGRLLATVIPTAHAAVVATYGPYNFGNNEDSGDTSSGGGGGGAGPASTGTRVDRGGSNGNSTDTDTNTTAPPTPAVLGEQVSVVPQGAPDAGAGGAAGLTYVTVMTPVLTRRRLTL